MAGIGFGTNYDAKPSNGLGPRTRIVSVNKGTGDHSQAELDALVAAMTVGVDGTADAVTVAGISGTVGADPLYIAVQGTGRIGTTEDDYVTGITVAVVADFDQTPV